MERARWKAVAASRNNSAGGAAGWTALRAPESRERCEMCLKTPSVADRQASHCVVVVMFVFRHKHTCRTRLLRSELLLVFIFAAGYWGATRTRSY